MAFTGNFSCNVFKTGLMNGTFNFTSGTFYIALYTNAATLDASTTAYTATGEVVASVHGWWVGTHDCPNSHGRQLRQHRFYLF